MGIVLPKRFNDFDGLIKKWAAKYHIPWPLIKAQVWQESGFNPRALSPCGAQGLMQLMPGTDMWLDGDMDGFDPDGNLENGVRYDRFLYERFPEIPDGEERLKFMLASYNGGRGYINRALEIAYDCEFQRPMPIGHKGCSAGEWQTWAFTSALLCSPYCTVKGKRPDYRQILDYVESVFDKHKIILEMEGGKNGKNS